MRKINKQPAVSLNKFLYSVIVTIFLIMVALVVMFLSSFLRQVVTSSISSMHVGLQTKTAKADTLDDYYRITQDAYLFKTSDTQNFATENIYFILPKTYFVKVLNFSQDQKTALVSYNDVVGFAESSALSKVSFTPKTPHYCSLGKLNQYSTHIRSTPSCFDTNNIIAVLPSDTTNITILGWVFGDTPNDGVSKKWYYCVVQASDTIVHIGYIYSERISPITQFLDSTETAPQTTPTSSIPATITDNPKDTETSPQLTLQSKIILVVVFSVPILALFFVLVFPHKRKTLKPKADPFLPFNDSLDTTKDSLRTKTDKLSTIKDKVNTTFKTRRTTLDTLNTSSDRFKKSYDTLNTSSDNRRTTFDTLNTSSDRFKKSYDTLNTSSDNLSTGFDATNTSLNSFNSPSDKLKTLSERNQTTFAEFNQSSSILPTALDKNSTTSDTFNPASDNLKISSVPFSPTSASFKTTSDAFSPASDNSSITPQGLVTTSDKKRTLFDKFFSAGKSPKPTKRRLYPADDEPL